MKILSWNIRGLGNPRNVKCLRHVLKVYNPQAIFFMETMIRNVQMKRTRMSLGFLNGFDVFAEGSRGRLTLGSKGNLLISLRSYSLRHIDVEILDTKINSTWLFTEFYGSPYAINRSVSWNTLREIGQNRNYPWIVCGISMKYCLPLKKRVSSQVKRVVWKHFVK